MSKHRKILEEMFELVMPWGSLAGDQPEADRVRGLQTRTRFTDGTGAATMIESIVTKEQIAAILRAHQDDDAVNGIYEWANPTCSCGYDLSADDALKWVDHAAEQIWKLFADD